jgi:competence protein ComEC
LSIGLQLARFFSNLPFAAVKTITPTVIEIGCYYTALATLFLWVRERKAKSNPSDVEQHMGKPWLPNGYPVKWAAISILIIISADTLYWMHHRYWHTDLRVTVLDVGQGNASLLEFPGGRCVLIDGGGFTDNSLFDVGARIVAPVLWRKKIQTIDTVILSHPDSDHLNGLLYILEHFSVKQVWSTHDPATTRNYQKFIECIHRKNISFPSFKALPRQSLVKNAALLVHYPPFDFPKQKDIEKWRTANNNSLVVQVVFGSQSILFPGDIQAPAEKELADMAGRDLKSTVLIAAHHGSETSNTEVFMNQVQPEITIISAGWKNRFHFPASTVLKRFKSRGCQIYETSKHGAVSISTDGSSLSVTPTVVRPVD